MKKSILYTIFFLFLMTTAAIAAQDSNMTQSQPTEETIADVNESDSVAVAIIDFESSAPGNTELGKQLGDILTARLSIYSQYQLVERRNMQTLFAEHQLSLSGLTDTEQVIKVGKIVGAKIMIFGSVFTVDKDLYIAAKIVGVETSQVKGVLATGKIESDLSEIISQLSDKLIEGLDEWVPQLLPKTDNYKNPLLAIKEQLKDKKLPTVAIMVTEEHMNRPAVGDPAAQTEIKKVFKEVGFEVIETDRETLKKWTQNYSMAGVDIVITGEGFSEFAARIGGLVSCTARLELQATQREEQMVISSEQTTKRAVDLSENIAAKTALQACGRELAIQTIQKISETVAEQDTLESEHQ